MKCSVREVIARTVILYRLGVAIIRVLRLGCDWKGERAPASPLQPVLKHGGSLTRKGNKPRGDSMRK